MWRFDAQKLLNYFFVYLVAGSLFEQVYRNNADNRGCGFFYCFSKPEWFTPLTERVVA
jgi:hypothetical protein